MKNFICAFALVAMVGLVGCATTGGGAGGSAGESKSQGSGFFWSLLARSLNNFYP